MARSRPHVTLCAAASIDGRIAAASGDSKLSSRADLARLHRLRAASDAVLVGRNTVRRDDPLLTVRLARGRNPVRVILDSRGTLPSSSRIARTARDVPTVVAASRRITARNAARLRRLHVDVLVAGTGPVRLGDLLRQLHSRGIRRLLVEGGGRTNWEFLRTGLFDEVLVTVSPRVLGGGASTPLAAGPGFRRVSDSPRLRLESARRLENHLLLRYAKL